MVISLRWPEKGFRLARRRLIPFMQQSQFVSSPETLALQHITLHSDCSGTTFGCSTLIVKLPTSAHAAQFWDQICTLQCITLHTGLAVRT